jgi:dTDP-4-amino-4,6-dideoxygalactose transaminase
MARVVDSGAFILGPEVSAFEEEFAAYCGARHAVGVANGTDALTIAPRALGVGAGDEVIVPSFTFYASAEAIPPTGARPVFCESTPIRSASLPRPCAQRSRRAPRRSSSCICSATSPRWRRSRPSGGAGDRGRGAGRGLVVRRGAPRGLGTLATFSFFPSRNLGCFEDGGAVPTSDDELADRVRMLRFHGSRDKVTYEHVGQNSRLDAPAAGLAHAGIGHKAYYRVPVHRQPAMLERGRGLELSATEEVARTHLAIPMSPMLDRGQPDEVAAAARAAVVAV